MALPDWATGAIQGVGAASGLAGAIGNLINGPRKQYKYNKKLMQEQARLNEEAAVANQQRSLEMFDHQFAKQIENQQAQNAFNSASAQRARNEIAGISKAALTGGSSATPAAAMGGSSASGSGSASGVSPLGVDVSGYGASLASSGQRFGELLGQIGLLSSQKNLMDAQASESGSRASLNSTQELLNAALTELAGNQAISESFKKDILEVQSYVARETRDNTVTLSDYAVDELFQKIELLKKQNSFESERNRIYRRHGERQTVAAIEQMEAAATLSWMESKGVLSKIGLNDAQAALFVQLTTNAVHDGKLKAWEARFRPLKDKIDAIIDVGDYKRRDEVFNQELRQFKAYLIDRGVSHAESWTQMFLNFVNMAGQFGGSNTDEYETEVFNYYGNGRLESRERHRVGSRR